MPKTRLLPVLVLLVFACVGVSQSLRANTIGPGESTTTPTVFTSGLDTLTYVDQSTLGPDIYGISLISAVYSEPDGSLDFMFQIDQPTFPAVTLLSVSSFTSFSTDVGYITDPSLLPSNSNPFVTPTGTKLGVASVGRTPDGNAVVFNGNDTGPFLSYEGPGDILVIKTNATNYDNEGTFTIGLGDPSGSFEPIAAPEPDTLTLLATGLIGLALAGSLKRKALGSISS